MPVAAVVHTITSMGIVRAGGAVGRVGVPHYDAISGAQPMFYRNVIVAGGPAPVRAYIDELLPDVMDWPHRARPRVRPHGRSRRRTRRLPRYERSRGAEGPGTAVTGEGRPDQTGELSWQDPIASPARLLSSRVRPAASAARLRWPSLRKVRASPSSIGRRSL